MTNLEALQSVIGSNYPFDENIYQKALVDQDINPDDSYSSENKKGIDLAFAGILLSVIVSVDIQEGGYKVTNADRNALIKILNSIYQRWDLPPFVDDQNPVLQSINLW